MQLIPDLQIARRQADVKEQETGQKTGRTIRISYENSSATQRPGEDPRLHRKGRTLEVVRPLRVLQLP